MLKIQSMNKLAKIMHLIYFEFYTAVTTKY